MNITAGFLKKKSGQLIVLRRPQEDEESTAEMYGPCPFCLGFLKMSELWRQKKSSQFAKDKTDSSSLRKMSKMMLAESIAEPGVSSNLHKYVFSSMKRDQESLISKNDPLICKFGMDHLDTKSVRSAHVVSQQMRLLSRLLLEIRKLPPCCPAPNKDLAHILNPSHFDVLVEGIKKLCKYQAGNLHDDCPGSFSTPSVVLKLGPYLKECAMLQRGKALREGDVDVVSSVDRFLQLHVSEYKKLSSIAVKQKDTAKFNKQDMLPLTSDIKKLRDYQVAEIERLSKLVNEDNISSYRQLCNVFLSRVICFNKRRSGEASLMKIASYKD
ncbi:hypothetical protein HOLleu_11128 [Holothuria leucospilota]|uniref:Uncharacterized protein n=1 Tax=Holothuria leucospilota TaxID=206669 RepID=A0A9Q1CFS4_HOLLE|nr:hypothetical protein HOLleu_11128 [Holothuria leucospilota]